MKANAAKNCTIVRDLLTTDEAVRYLSDRGLPDTTAGMLIARRVYGLAPKFLKLGRAVMYRPSDLEEWRVERIAERKTRERHTVARKARKSCGLHGRDDRRAAGA
jgi:hypothetical protein